MKTFIQAASFAAVVSAAAVPSQQCCFQLIGTKGVTGPVGQLSDGQNRVGGNETAATYCINNGALTDASGRGCILTPPTTQFQCDKGASPTTGFSIAANGSLEYNGSAEFFACPATSNMYNLYTTPVANQPKCVVEMLQADACYGSGVPVSSSSHSTSTSSHATSSATSSKPAGTTVSTSSHSTTSSKPSATVMSTSSHTTSSTSHSTTSTSSHPSSAVSTSTHSSTLTSSHPSSAAATTHTTTVSHLTTVVTTIHLSSTLSSSHATASTSSHSTTPLTTSSHSTTSATTSSHSTTPMTTSTHSTTPMTTSTHSSTPVVIGGTTCPAVSTVTVTVTHSSSSVAATTAMSSSHSSSAVTPGYLSAVTTPATSASSSACPTTLTGAYQTPHLIVPVSSSHPNTAYGTQYNGMINSTTSSIFNFDIPASYAGKTCSIIFLLPEQSQLKTSSYTLSGTGDLIFSQLASAANQQTEYANAPAKKSTLDTVVPAPGHSYVVATSQCAAGTTQSVEISSTGSLSLEFFEDYNPAALGLFLTSC